MQERSGNEPLHSSKLSALPMRQDSPILETSYAAFAQPYLADRQTRGEYVCSCVCTSTSRARRDPEGVPCLGSLLRFNFGLFLRPYLARRLCNPQSSTRYRQLHDPSSNQPRWFALAGGQSCPHMGQVRKAEWIPLPGQLGHSARTSVCFLAILIYQDADMWSATSSSLSILLIHYLHSSR